MNETAVLKYFLLSWLPAFVLVWGLLLASSVFYWIQKFSDPYWAWWSVAVLLTARAAYKTFSEAFRALKAKRSRL